mgnify:FL=1|jgi:hypothetical protein
MKASKQGSLAALAVILFAVIIALLFFSCEKIEEEPITTGNVTFWTTEDSGSTYWDTGWILYVDDVKYGTIKTPYNIGTIDKIPLCGDTRFTNISLRPGNHYYYLTRSLPLQPPPNYFRGQTRFFDVTLGGCVVLRAEQ